MITDHDPPLIALPNDLDDQAAAKLLEFFLDAARVLENHYAAQLLRQHHRPDERQCPLWPDDDPPF
jgi:hypothetical protein